MREFIIDTFILIQYVALLLVAFYILFQSKFFYRMENEKGERVKMKKSLRFILLIVLFGILSMLATESGVRKVGAIGTVRDLAPMAAGFLQGPIAGLGAGLIGAIHRAFQGGISCLPCSLATLLSGLLAGLYYLIRKKKFISPLEGLIFGTLFESFHIGLVVLYGYINEFIPLTLTYHIQNPLQESIEIAKTLGPPMIIANGVGLFLFTYLIQQYRSQLDQKMKLDKIENEIEVVNSLQTSILPTLSSEGKKKPAESISFTKLKPYMILEHFEKGHILFHKNDDADKIYYIREGFIRLPEIDKVFGHPELIGETGIFTPSHKRTMTAVCETDLDVYTINTENITKAIHAIPSLLFDLIHLSIRRFTVNLRDSISEKERMESELKIAESIQASMLPRKFPPFPDRTEFDIYAHTDPAKEVGGDFFDFVFTPCDNKLFFTIADVSGKSIPGALFMVITKTLLKTEALRCSTPGEILCHVNDLLCPDNDECMFVTVFCGMLNVDTGILEFSNAGHNPPLLSTKDGDFNFIKVKSGFVLAGMDNFTYETEKLQMYPGDTLFLYTDGVTEAMNENDEQFSNARLKDVLLELKGKGVKDILESIREAVKTFSGDAPQSDDVTMLVLKYNGK